MLVVLVSVVLSCASYEETIVPEEERFVQRVIEVNKDKEELYSTFLRWMAYSFGSSKEVIELADKEEGIIIGKGSIDVTYTIMPLNTHFTLTAEFKDKKVRVTFTGLYIEDPSTSLGAFPKSPLTGQNQIDKFTETIDRRQLEIPSSDN